MSVIQAKYKLETLIITCLFICILMFVKEYSLIKEYTASTNKAEVISGLQANQTQNQIESNSQASLIIEKNLFGFVKQEALEEIIPEDLPETNLQLILRGVVASNYDVGSSAMIQGPDGIIINYFTGDEVPGDASIKNILGNRVILERRGRLETLLFPEQGNNASTPTRRMTFTGQGAKNTSSSLAQGNTQTRSNNESMQERDTRLRTQLQRLDNSQTKENLRQRLDQLRNNTAL